MNLLIKLYSENPRLQREIGRWALQDELTPKDVKIQGSQPNEIGGVDIEVECEMDFILRWLVALPKPIAVEGEELVDMGVSGAINFWKLHEILAQIKSLEFTIEEYYANVKDGIDETDCDFSFQVPVSCFVDLSAETQTQVATSKEGSRSKKDETPHDEEKLQELKAIIRQSKSEVDMLKDIASLLEFDLEDIKLLQRAYEDYKDLSKEENKQLRGALAPAFDGKRIDHTVKELKKLYDQYHPTTAVVEFPDSQEVTAATSVFEENTKSETSGSTPEPSEERYIFDNTINEEPPHTEEGQDGDDTSSEEDDEEEDPHT